MNLRDWQNNPDEAPDLDLLDDEDAEAEYWKATDEAIEMVKDGVWK